MMKLAGCFAFVALLFTNVRGQGNGAIRLFNNGASIQKTGIVEVYYNSKWNTVCDIDTGLVGNTICRQLGYFDGTTVENFGFGDDSISPGFSSVSCDDSDINLLSCYYDTSSTDCTSSQYLAVQCEDNSFFDYSGKVRLTGFTDYSGQGRIEAYCNSDWGLVCNDGFTQNDADTVCRQLGYTEAIDHGSNYGSGDSTQSVWFDNPGCGSSTNCLSNCRSCPSSSFSCSVSNVAGVTCSYDTTSSGDAGSYDYCFLADDGTIKGLVGIIIGAIIAVLVCAAIAVLIPIICCCCLGVGIGTAASRPHYSNI